MDDVNIIYVANPEECEEIVTNFLTLFMKSNRMKKINKNDDTNIVLSKSSVLVFVNSCTLDQDVKTTLGNLISNENLIMILIVSRELTDQQTSIPVFTTDSKVCMWASVTGGNDKKCIKTEENIRASRILDCFLSIIPPVHEMMEVEKDHGSVRVICSEISKQYYKSFEKFMRTHMGLSTRLVDGSKNSNRTPLVALCLKHDDTETEIKTLEKEIAGSQATIVMIIECAQNVPLMPTQLLFNKKVFPYLVRLPYSISNCEFYDCEEAKSTVDRLKKNWSHYDILGLETPIKSKKKGITQKAVFSRTFPSATSSRGKQILKKPQNPSINCKSFMNLPAPLNQGCLKADSIDIAILCSRTIEVCKNIFMNIKSQCSIRREFPWISKVEEASKSAKLILVCLKISRLTDDIADAIKMAGLSANQKFFLVVIHTIEPGVEAETSVPMQDERILDVASILHSENVGCYDCPENRAAKSKICSWFT